MLVFSTLSSDEDPSLVGDRKTTFYRRTRCGDKLAPTTCKKPRTHPDNKLATAKNSHTDSHEKMTHSEYLQAYVAACKKAQSDSDNKMSRSEYLQAYVAACKKSMGTLYI